MSESKNELMVEKTPDQAITGSLKSCMKKWFTSIGKVSLGGLTALKRKDNTLKKLLLEGQGRRAKDLFPKDFRRKDST